jgi:ribosomal protein S12 methylthiotransferase
MAVTSQATAPTVTLIALGCAKNNIDAEQTLAELATAGFQFSADAADADLILINTCGFIAAARAETEKTIARALRHKRRRPQLKVAIMGCYAQRFGAEILAKFPALDGIFGLDVAGKISTWVSEILAGTQRVCGLTAAPRTRERQRQVTTVAYAYLRLGDGCANRCTYCTIPTIRGDLRSRTPSAIIAEARELGAAGFQELILIAQDTTHYGADLTPRTSLDHLLPEILRVTAAPRLRLLYAHPRHLTVETLKLLGAEPRLCHYLDLPLQHVNSRLLTRMNRGYDRRRIDEILTWREKFAPHLCLRTSFIVGFPGETAAEFRELEAFVAAGVLTHLGVFTYSPESGTPAAQFPAPVAPQVAKRRQRVLMLRQQKIVFQRLEARVGTVETILLDREVSGQGNGGAAPTLFAGRSAAEAPEIDPEIFVSAPKKKSAASGAATASGKFARVKITARRDYDLLAKILP